MPRGPANEAAAQPDPATSPSASDKPLILKLCDADAGEPVYVMAASTESSTLQLMSKAMEFSAEFMNIHSWKDPRLIWTWLEEWDRDLDSDLCGQALRDFCSEIGWPEAHALMISLPLDEEDFVILLGVGVGGNTKTCQRAAMLALVAAWEQRHPRSPPQTSLLQAVTVQDKILVEEAPADAAPIQLRSRPKPKPKARGGVWRAASESSHRS